LLDVFHLFGHRKWTDISQVHYLYADFQGNQFGPNPNFGKGKAFQPPMTIRFGIETSF
jgi:hypothetical protein